MRRPDFPSSSAVSAEAFVRLKKRLGTALSTLIFEAELRGKPITFIVECKREPRYLRQAANQLRDTLWEYPTAYPIVISPYISGSSAALLAGKRRGTRSCRKRVDRFEFGDKPSKNGSEFGREGLFHFGIDMGN
jgi:hypothetical protein